MNKDILYKKEGSIGRVVLNREEQKNTFDVETLKALTEAFKKSDENGDICVLYTAEGKHFTYGVNLKYAYSLMKDAGGSKESSQLTGSFQDVTRAMRNHRGIIIGGLKGYIIGGGFEITLSCDLRIAASDTTIMFPELSIGTMFSNASTKLLPRIVGEGRAKEIMIMGKSIDAEEALAIGLVNHVCKPEELDAVLERYAKEILEKDAYAVKVAKKLINENQDIDVESTLEKEYVGMMNCGLVGGFESRLKDFVEKHR